MWNTPSTLSLPGPLWSRMIVPDKGPIYGSNRTKPWFREFTVLAFKLRATCPLSRKLFKLDKPDMQGTAGEAEMNS